MSTGLVFGPQPQAVLAPLSKSAIFLILTIRTDGEAVVRGLLPDLGGIQRAVGFRDPDARLSCVTGIGANAWDRLFPGPGARPAHLHPFQPVAGARHIAPATPGDLLFHIRSCRFDLCFEFASRVRNRLAGAADVVDEVHGFRYFDNRDLLGFVDGTENPTGAAAKAAVLIGDEDPTFRSGSYVVVQKYLHDLDGWNALTVEEQERAFGRHKLSDIEFADEDKPSNSHLVLNTIVDADGTERQILRDNMPFGAVGEDTYGTYYIAYAADPGVTELMLRNMFIGVPPGNHDRILDFSTAVTGGLFFVPSADMLNDPTATLGDVAAATSESPTPANGSLAIGSLKRSGIS